MTRFDQLVVLAATADIAWRFVWALLRADDALRTAPWPMLRRTPEPPRLRLVRPLYDWQKDEATGPSQRVAVSADRAPHGGCQAFPKEGECPA